MLDPKWSDMYMNRKLSYLNTELFFSVSQNISSNTNLQSKPFFITTTTELTATPLYCFTMLLEIKLLSLMYRVILVYSHLTAFE